MNDQYEQMNERADRAWADFKEWLRAGDIQRLRDAYEGIEAGYALPIDTADREPGRIARDWAVHAFTVGLPGALRWPASAYPLTTEGL